MAKKGNVTSRSGGRPAATPPPSSAGTSRGVNHWLVLGAILLAGLCLRACYLREVVDAPDFARPTKDPQFKDYWARAMVSGDWTPPPGEERGFIDGYPYPNPPGYSFFLAATYFLTDSSYLAPRVAQLVIGLANCLLMFALAKALYGRAAGLIGAALMATYWALIYYEGELNQPVLLVFLLLVCINLLHRWVQNPRLLYAITAGGVAGAAVLLRPDTLPSIGLVLFWMAWVTARKKDGRRFTRSASAFALSAAVIIAPVTIRNYLETGGLTLVSHTGEVSLCIGNNSDADGYTPYSPELRELVPNGAWNVFDVPVMKRTLERKLGKDDLTYREWRRYFVNEGLTYITQNPGRTLRLMAKRAVLSWSPVEVDENKVVHYEKAHSPTLRYLPGFPLPLSLFLLGLLMLVRDYVAGRAKTTPRHAPPPETGRWLETTVLALLFMLSYYAVFLPLIVGARYRIPQIPFMFLFGAYGLYRLGQFAVARDYRRTAIWGAAAAALFALAHVQFIPFEPNLSRWHDERRTAYAAAGRHERAIEDFSDWIESHPKDEYAHYNLGVLLLDSGDAASAIPHFTEALRLNPGYGAVHYNLGLGRALAAKGLTQEAVAQYREALRVDPNHLDALNNLGYELTKTGAFEQAKDLFDRVLELDPHNPLAHFNLGYRLVQEGDLDKGIDHYTQALAASPDDPNTHYNLGLALEKSGRPDQALERFLHAVRLDPDLAGAHYSAGVALQQHGKLAEARQHYAQTVRLAPEHDGAHYGLGLCLEQAGEHAEAISHFTEALRLNPASELVHYSLAKLAEREQHYDEAILHYEKAMKNSPKSSCIPNDLGILLGRLGRTQEAIDAYQIALTIDPKNPDIHNNVGYEAYMMGDLEKALEHYRHALAIMPGFVLVWNNLGTALGEQGKTDDAIEAYSEALRLQPQNADIHNSIGFQYAQKGDVEKALEHYNEAVRLVPKFPLAYNNLGNLMVAQGNVDEALRYYGKALEIHPRDDMAHFNIANVLADQDRLDEAVTHYLKAIENNTQNPNVPNNLANALMRMNRFAEADPYYRAVLRMDPNHLQANCNLGSLLLASGQHDEAIAHFNKVLSIDPNYQVAREGLNKALAAKQGAGT